MKIKRDASIKSVLLKYQHIMNLSPAKVIKRLKEEDLTGYIILKRRFWFDKKVEPKSPPELTMRDLMAFEKITKGNDSLVEFLSIILRKKSKKKREKKREKKYNILRLEFVGAFVHFIWFSEQVKKIFEKFNTLNIPLTQEEQSARNGVKCSNYGLYDLVGLFIKICPQYKREEAELLSWEDVFKALQKHKEGVLIERNYAKIMSKKR